MAGLRWRSEDIPFEMEEARLGAQEGAGLVYDVMNGIRVSGIFEFDHCNAN